MGAVQAVRDEIVPIFEYMMLNWEEVKAGHGRFHDPLEAVQEAAERVNDVYRRYGKVLREWDAESHAAEMK